MDMDDILGTGVAQAAPVPTAGITGEAAASDATGDPEAAEGAPPAPGGAHVPLAALEAERRGRRDWKEKAIRAEAERDLVREQLGQLRPAASPDAPRPDAPRPDAPRPDARWNERLNISESMLRQQHDDVDARIAVFRRAAAANPALIAQLKQQDHPYQWAYEQAERLRLLEEIGADPAAYRRRVEAEVRASLSGGAASSAFPASVPASLATARSASPRGAGAWTGPTPLSDILPR